MNITPQEAISFQEIIIALAGFFSAYYVKQMAQTLRDVVRSVNELNNNVATIIERTEHHGEEINKLRSTQEELLRDVAHIKGATIGKSE